jgi:hypothetical protein
MIAFCRIIPAGIGSALLGAFIVAVPTCGSSAQPNAAAAAGNETRLAFLSGRRDETSAQEAPNLKPDLDNRSFDGRWIFTSAGCPKTGSLPATIRKGRIIVRGGSGMVDPDGTLHSVGAGGGMTLTAVGQLSGNNGSGTFNRSDGCVGSWIAIKRQ